MNIAPFAIEVHLIPLPPQELEERRRHLHTLLLRGALRHASFKNEPESENLVEVKAKDGSEDE